MAILQIAEIKLLHQSEKSRISLVRDRENGKQMVKKELKGICPIYLLLNELSHPLLPAVYSVEQRESSTIVMEEYIRGQTLSSINLPRKKLLAAFRELCDVLSFLHRQGIVHRDIKPSNILLAEDGHIRLIDFDAARMIKDDAEQDTRLLGTRGYAPPEQYGFSQTDERSDIYALGITLGQLLGERASWTDRHIIRKCTQVSAEKRYQTMAQVKNALSHRTARLSFCGVLALALCCAAICGVSNHIAPRQPDMPEDAARYIFSERDKGTLYSEDPTFKAIQLDEREFSKGLSSNMSDVLDDSGEEAHFSISRDHPNGTRITASYGEWMQNLAYDEWAEELPEAYDQFGYLSPNFHAQVSTCDLDKDGVKEVLVTVGDDLTESVTAVYSLNRSNREQPFSYVGYVPGMDSFYFSDSYFYTKIGWQDRYEIHQYKDREIIKVKDANE